MSNYTEPNTVLQGYISNTDEVPNGSTIDETNEFIVSSIGNIQTEVSAAIMDAKTQDKNSLKYLKFKYSSLLAESKILGGVNILLDIPKDGLVKATITNVAANGVAIGASVVVAFVLSPFELPAFAIGGISFITAGIVGSVVKDSIGNGYDNIISKLDKLATSFTYDAINAILTIRDGIASYNDAMMYAKFLESFYKDLDGSNLLGGNNDSIGKILLDGTDEAGNSFTYEIKPGDTVWDLCQKYGLTYDELIELNPWLSDRFSDDREFCLIRPEETLKIPCKGSGIIDVKPTYDTGFKTAGEVKHIIDPMFLDLNKDEILETTSVLDGINFD